MSHYLLKYKGTYRVLPELDNETMDIPRDFNGEIAEGYDDLYIKCSFGNKIFAYGSEEGKKVVYLMAYIPSIGRGRNISKALTKQGVEFIDYSENDEEVVFKFKAKDIEPVAELMKATTSGASISPFSVKNLPKAKDAQIPTDEIERYKAISALVQKGDLLLIHRITEAFLVDFVQKSIKKRDKDKTFDVRADMKKCMMSRLAKEYIYHKGFWNEYLDHLKQEIEVYYKEKGK